MQELLCVAVVPGILLLVFIYVKDPIEKEPMGLLLSLLALGVASALVASVVETVLFALLPDEVYTYREYLLWLVIQNFVMIALAEEGSKFFFLRLRTWNHKAFDYEFDGIVYAVFVSLGFAIFENIRYVWDFGFATGLLRAVTAMPGHTVFAVYMGFFYGKAKRAQVMGDWRGARSNQLLALMVATVAHGTYDFTASFEGVMGVTLFFVTITFLFLMGLMLVNRCSKDALRIYPEVDGPNSQGNWY